MKSLYILLLLQLVALSATVSFAQSISQLTEGGYEYAILAVDEQIFLEDIKYRVYFGNGKVEEVGTLKRALSRETTVKNMDILATAMNYLANQGYELVTVMPHRYEKEESSFPQYVFRRKQP